MEHKRPTQVTRVLNYLHDFGSITQWQALQDLGIMRLASRMAEIKKQGIPIKKEMVEVKNRYQETARIAKYSIGEQL